MKFKRKASCRGQAALMDSIFFLTIVASITAGMFFFTINYGLQTESQLASFYSADFASDVLKVVSYINVLRDGSEFSYVISGEAVELDYLLALIKEDYFDKKEMSDPTVKAIASTMGATMKPFDNSYDYAFYLVNESEQNFLFLLIAIHECTSGEVICNDPTVTDKIVDRVFFYCKPEISDFLEQQVFPAVGKVDSGYGKVTLSETVGDRMESKIFIMGLNIWRANTVEPLKDLEDNAELVCERIDLTAP